MENMSEKDKKTLVIVLAVIFALLGVMMIKNAWTSLAENISTQSTLSATKQKMETAIANTDNYKTQLKAAKKTYTATADTVFGDLDQTGIDTAATNNLVTASGLSPLTLSITEVTKMTPVNYTVTSALATANGATTTATGTGFVASTTSTTRFANVSITATGTYDQIVAFLHTLNTNPGVQLINTSFNTTGDTISVSASFLMVLSDSVS
jgi:hypothetical protein